MGLWKWIYRKWRHFLYTYEESGSFTPALILDDGLGCVYAVEADTSIEINNLAANFVTNDTLAVFLIL